MSVNDLRVMGRATQGVKVIKLGDDDDIASVAKIEESVLAAEGQTENGEDIIAVVTEDGTTSETAPNEESAPESNDNPAENNDNNPEENTEI